MIVRKPDTSQYPDVSGTRCIQLTIPDDDSYARLIAGLFGLLCNSDNWVGEEVDREARALLVLEAITETDWEVCLTSNWLSYLQRIWKNQYDSVSGNAMIWSSNTSFDNGGIWYQSASAIDDEIHYKIALKAGVYSLLIMYTLASSCGKFTIKVDGVTWMDIDAYHSSNQFNQTTFVTNKTIAADGVYTVDVKTYGHTSPSTAYLNYLAWMDFRRVQDL